MKQVVDARLREQREEGSRDLFQGEWGGVRVMRAPRIARAVALALIVAIASGCAERKPSPEKLFEMRVKCDKMVREKIVKVEDSDRYSQIVTSHLAADLRCYGKEQITKFDGNAVEYQTVNLIDGLSGKQLGTTTLFDKNQKPDSIERHYLRLESIDKMMSE